MYWKVKNYLWNASSQVQWVPTEKCYVVGKHLHFSSCPQIPLIKAKTKMLPVFEIVTYNHNRVPRLPVTANVLPSSP
jgi:hypothetical protein